MPGVRFGGRAPAAASGGTGSRHRFELGRSRMAGDAPELVRPGPWFPLQGSRRRLRRCPGAGL
ncbi:hypothetical protein ACH4YO_40465 [Streptomyces noursei]|uniref:hypothetical protein n=1 Tax=Streptomyces noursei TaxID=1971 RepID=UPI0033CA892E